MPHPVRRLMHGMFAVLGALLLGPLCAAAQDTPLEASIRAAFERGKLHGLHAAYVIHKGETAAEIYFEGRDQNWGRPLGVVAHGPETLHDLRSVTKSVTALLYGIALDRGLVPAPSAPLLDQFPEYLDLRDDPQRRAITIGDTLSMQMGVAWNEDIPYTDPRNSEIAMETADDRYYYALSQPMVTAPGTEWVYNGGATAIIARIIEKGVGKPLDQFAEEALFAPLGVTKWEWVSGADGVPSAASGLRLTTHGLAAIGMTVKDGGVYKGARVVSESWVNEMKAPRVTLNFGLRYGYFWWLPDGDGAPRWFAGFGNGGQRLTVNPADDLIIVIFGGRYNEADHWRLPVGVIMDHIAPVLFPR